MRINGKIQGVESENLYGNETCQRTVNGYTEVTAVFSLKQNTITDIIAKNNMIYKAWYTPNNYRLPNNTRKLNAEEAYSILVPVDNGNKLVKAKKLISSELHCSKTNKQIAYLYKTREPVLFIHGYVGNNDFGGGDEYWGNFLQLIDELEIDGTKYLSYDFRWRTNARFQDVAEDLFSTVKNISETMDNKKVHIVAHSFGGILARTMLQGIFPEEVSGLDPEKYVASLTTIGTPHSGISNKQKTMAGRKFPKGQDSLGHKFANQISVHQMGESTLHDETKEFREDTIKVYAVGEIAAALADLDKSPFPTNLPVQVAIGLNAVPCVLCPGENIYKIGDGDKLISYKGQRFHPGLTLNGEKDLLKNQNVYIDSNATVKPIGAVITEKLIGLEDYDFKPGYRAERSFFLDKCSNFGRLGFVHSVGVSNWYLKGEHYSFIENFVDCESVENCNHVGFGTVKDWLKKFSSTSKDIR